jgi:hypothetical protein
MPQASSEIIEEFEKLFGRNAADNEAIKFLLAAGYSINSTGCIRKSDRVIMTESATACINYLIYEWDYCYE